MRKLLLKDFMEWYFSDENSEGFSISQKNANHLMNGFNAHIFQKLLEDCKVIPLRLTIDADDGHIEGHDISVKFVELVGEV